MVITTVGHKKVFFHVFLPPSFEFKITHLPAHNTTYIARIGILYFISRYENVNFKLFLSYYYCHKIVTRKKKKKKHKTTQNKLLAYLAYLRKIQKFYQL